MKAFLPWFAMLGFVSPLIAQTDRDRRSLLDSDPEVAYLSEIVDKPIKLKVIKEAPVYSDKNGTRRLGFLKADQVVELEEMTEKVYRVRGKGTRNGIAGWVAPWAFSHPQEDFVAKLKKLFERQMAVNEIIAANGVAIGMTENEVAKSLGKPTKTSVRRTADGQESTWEFIIYEDVNHYVTRVDAISGQVFRQLSHVTREEKGKTTVEFKDSLVTALEETEDNNSGNPRIVVPPFVFAW